MSIQFGGFNPFAQFALPERFSSLLQQASEPSAFAKSPRLDGIAKGGVIPTPAGLNPEPITARPPQVNPLEAAFNIAPERGSGVRYVSPEQLGALRYERSELQVSNSLELEIVTQEGDRVSLDFQQTDFALGEQVNGSGAASSLYAEGFERAVSLSVVGELSEQEFAAISDAIAAVTETAGRFFNGDLTSAAQSLGALGFGNATLAEVSLDLSQTTNAEFTQVYEVAPQRKALESLSLRDGSVRELLDTFAAAQRELIARTQSILDAPSSVSFAQGIAPTLFAQPFQL